MYPITKKLKERVDKIYNYDANDERLPVVLCSSCQREIYRVEENTKLNFADTSQFSVDKIARVGATTPCKCQLCELSRMPRKGHVFKRICLPPRRSILKDISNEEVAGKFSEKNCFH